MAVPLKVEHKHNPRGNAPMPSKPKPPLEKGNIVETYQIGLTTVHICDDHVAKTQEEIEKVIDEMHTAGWKIIESAAEKGEAI